MAKAVTPPVISQWGTPDPHDKDAYPKVSETTYPQWAWELLRRRDDYRRCYEQLQRDGGYRRIVDAHINRENANAAIHISREDANAAMSAGKTVEWRSIREALREVFKVYPSRKNETLDPRENGAPLFEGVEIVHEIEVQPNPIMLPEVGILFDVSLPIEPQLDGARKLLADKAKKWLPSPQKRVQPPIKKFPLYLRLLDFEAALTPDKKIGAALFPEAKAAETLRDSIRDTLNAAQRWQRDYLLVALHSRAIS
jgi:hypothetical protein